MTIYTLPLRVLFVSHDTGMFGAQRVLLTLLSYLHRDQIIPYLIVPDDGLLAEEARDLDIPVLQRQIVHWLPCVRHVKKKRIHHLYETLRNIRSRAWAIAALIERHQIDLVYTNTITCIEGAIAARMTGKSHIWHIHEPVLGNSELAPIMPTLFYSFIVKVLSHSVIFPSHALAKTYPLLASRSIVIYNSLPIPDLLDREQARLALAKATGQDPSRKFVAVVGALQPRKDHINFLNAAQTILRENKEVLFFVVGTGPEEFTENLRSYAQTLKIDDSVIFMGWWPHEISMLLRGLDVLVISSEQESFGLTAIEAMAMEVPVVSTRCGGPEEIITDGATGFLVPVKDPQALAKAVNKLLNDTSLANQFGIDGRKIVQARFSIEEYIKRMEEIILRNTEPSINNPLAAQAK